ncbi:unnamed protein product [Amoebophrya sp. A120]|nr:unnamed protein product [Amoebophrya sp. A120]|eukprot:GSA120T00018968001.1
MNDFIQKTRKNPLPLFCILYGGYFLLSGVSHLGGFTEYVPLDQYRMLIKLVSLAFAVLFYYSKNDKKNDQSNSGAGPRNIKPTSNAVRSDEIKTTSPRKDSGADSEAIGQKKRKKKISSKSDAEEVEEAGAGGTGTDAAEDGEEVKKTK